MSVQRVALPLGRGAVAIRQHFFDAFVPQPRLTREALRHNADRSGLKNWPCAWPTLNFIVRQVLPDILEYRENDPLNGRGGQRERLRVLELGSGCGLLGIGIAASSKSTDVVLTDPDVPTRFAPLPTDDNDDEGHRSSLVYRR